MDILVIGDKQHERATCVDWTDEIPNIEEFDLVIVALNELTQQVFNQIVEEFSKIADQMRTLLRDGRSVWCIMGEPLLLERKESSKTIPYPSPTNYDWLPVPIHVVKVKEGTSIIMESSPDAKKLQPFFDKVKGWRLELAHQYRHPWGSSPLATNKSGKMISAVAYFDKRGGVEYLLPTPTECDTHEAIEILIDIATGEDKTEPVWREQVEITGISAIDAKISQHENEISAVQAKITDLRVKRCELEKYRDVFSVHEGPQVEAVQKILRDLDIETEKTPPGFPVDLVGKDIAVEVTSVAGKIDTSSTVALQLLRFREHHQKGERIVLVANTYKRDPPQDREGKLHFTRPVISLLTSNEICVMTAATLLEIWKLAKQDKRKAREMILGSVGEVRV